MGFSRGTQSLQQQSRARVYPSWLRWHHKVSFFLTAMHLLALCALSDANRILSIYTKRKLLGDETITLQLAGGHIQTETQMNMKGLPTTLNREDHVSARVSNPFFYYIYGMSKEREPEPSLSMSAIIFLISSFLGSNPSARMATFTRDGEREKERKDGRLVRV